jgi:hypothetical protein
MTQQSSKLNTLKGKMVFAVTLIAALLVMTMNLTPSILKANALDLDLDSLTNVDDIGQSAECVIVVVGCDGTGSVGSSGDTIIGSCNGGNASDCRGAEATLDVIYLVDCRSTGGQPSDGAVCGAALDIAPPSAFPVTIDANNPNPSSFPGSSDGTRVTLDAGQYRLDSDIDQAQDDLEQGLNTEEVSFDIGASGGSCINGESGDAVGTIRAGQHQTCVVQITIVVENGSVGDIGAPVI